MIEPEKTQTPVWDDMNLPVLTDVVEVPLPMGLDEDFDPTAALEMPIELSDLEAEITEPSDVYPASTELTIPDITLEELMGEAPQEAESVAEDALLDMSSLPSLDLNEQIQDSLPSEAHTDEEAFAFSLEPQLESDVSLASEAMWPSEAELKQAIQETEESSLTGEVSKQYDVPSDHSNEEGLDNFDYASALDIPDLSAELAALAPTTTTLEDVLAAEASLAPPAMPPWQPQAEFTSISIDSLPTGVLNGGMGLNPQDDLLGHDSPLLPGQVDFDLPDLNLETESVLPLVLEEAVTEVAEEAEISTKLTQIETPSPEEVLLVEIAEENPVTPAVVTFTEAAESLVEVEPEPEQTTIASNEIIPSTEAAELPAEPEPPIVAKSMEEKPETSIASVQAEPEIAPIPEEALSQSVIEPSSSTPPVIESVSTHASSTSHLESAAVQVVNISSVAAATSNAMMLSSSANRQGAVTIVDEQALLASMYEKMLPKMKESLAMWLQDALELQARQVMSNIMGQLQEDYEMLFGEALKESLRQTLGNLGKLETTDDNDDE